MKSKLFVFCPDCGSFDHEVKTKKDLYKFCPLCGKNLKCVKIPWKKYIKSEDEINNLGVCMWYGIETLFDDKK